MPVQQYGEPPHMEERAQKSESKQVDYSRELDEIDRWTKCDHSACNSQAYIKGVKYDMALYFCRHHGNKHVPALLSQGFAIQDESFKLSNR